MKRTILAASALALVAALFTMGNAQAADEGCNDITIGFVCATGDPADPDGPNGDIYADGDDDNEVEPLDGYIGVNDDEGVVGCANGSYDADHETDGTTTDDNSVITPIPPNPDDPPSGESGPCTPTGPSAP